MKRLLTSFIFICLVIAAQATHIVGGEIQMKYNSQFTNNGVLYYNYTFRLNLYFDEINGNPQAEDNFVVLYVYQKSNNSFVDSLVLANKTTTDIPYNYDSCQGNLVNNRTISYFSNQNLLLSKYTSSNGYYVMWERCCRNAVISNIVSPGESGNIFYLEFPSLINKYSSPVFNPLQDVGYACLGRDYNLSFNAVSQNAGTSLKYTMVTPLKGNTTDRQPVGYSYPAYTPYPPSTIVWATGYSATNAISSNVGKPLSINEDTGILSVNPNKTGLFVFSIKCEEFLDDVKLGEVRRDFQILVVVCEDNIAPTANIPLPDPDNLGNTINYVSEEELVLDLNISNCLDIVITDTPNEIIEKISIEPLNFSLQRSPLGATKAIINASGQAVVPFCWDECIDSEGQDNFLFNILIQDDACPFKGKDTIKVNLKVLPKINRKPDLSIISATNNFNGVTDISEIFIDEELSINFFGVDFDNDNISLTAIMRDVDEFPSGINFNGATGTGTLRATFSWMPDCSLIQNNGQVNKYIIDFILEETTQNCEILSDTITIEIDIKDKEANFDIFTPDNFFTPNNDDVNDCFGITNLPELPEENCLYSFQKIEVFNRWGKRVFESVERNFCWYGENYPAGMYFYIIDYKGSKFKGTVSIIK